jgi:hypothetical protein
MAQRRSFAPDDPFADLDKKVMILERELELQRAAMERLRTMGQRTSRDAHELEPAPVRKTA